MARNTGRCVTLADVPVDVPPAVLHPPTRSGSSGLMLLSIRNVSPERPVVVQPSTRLRRKSWRPAKEMRKP
jgi:hypothetical protein